VYNGCADTRAFLSIHDVRARRRRLPMHLVPTVAVYHDGEIVLRQGDVGDMMYIVMSGMVRIYREGPEGTETVLADLGFGETFGELSLFDDHPRSASARAIGETELRVITQEEFVELECDPIIRRMLITLGQRLRAVDDAFERLSTGEAQEVEALSELWDRRDWKS
jgi:CRP-like cAMP-binding protein